MSALEIPQLIPRQTQNPEPAHPGLERKPNAREITASKQVDDISRHESKPDMAPKHEPKAITGGNARDA